MKNLYTNGPNMIVGADELIPEDMMVWKSSSQYAGFHNPLIALNDMSRTLEDKLFFIAEYVRTRKVIFKDCLSSADKQIVEKMLNDNTTQQKRFWEKLLNKNEIAYKDSLYTHLKSDLEVLKKHDRITYTHLYKWFNLENHGQEKIDTIIDNKIYMGSPFDFNDRFDCQLHLSDEDISDIAESNKHNKPYIKFMELLLNHMTRVCSFSLINPMDVEANIMWGLYGNCGSGFAVSYKILGMARSLRKYEFDIKRHLHRLTMSPRVIFERINFIKVLYCELNVFDAFKTAIHKYFKSNSKTELGDFLYDLLCKKSVCWNHEEEFRIFKFVDINQRLKIPHTQVNNTIYEDAKSTLETAMKEELKSKSRYQQFIAPNQIFLGWGCDLTNQHIRRLLDYAKSNAIQVVQLNGKIHHQNKKFGENLI